MPTRYEDQEPPTVVCGVVDLWGTIVCGEQGWRGEWARIIALVQREKQPRRVERSVAEAYGVPLLEEWPPLSEVTLPDDMEEVPENEHREDQKDDRGGAGAGVLTAADFSAYARSILTTHEGPGPGVILDDFSKASETVSEPEESDSALD